MRPTPRPRPAWRTTSSSCATNPDFWAQCDSADAPNSAEASPINQQWDGAGEDKRKWRKLPGVAAEYTIELLHTATLREVRSRQAGVADRHVDRHVQGPRHRAAQTEGTQARAKRSIDRDVQAQRLPAASSTSPTRRTATRRPTTNASSDRTSQQVNCVNRNRTRARGKGCVEIQFPTDDAINGPLHTNDESLLVCGTPTFGRETLEGRQPGRTDSIEVSGAAPGYMANTGCSATPQIFTPTDDKFTVRHRDDADARLKPGTPDRRRERRATSIPARRSSGSRTRRWTSPTSRPTARRPRPTTSRGPATASSTSRTTASCNGEIPTEANYDESVACGNVYVSGIYSRPLTIAAANDVIVRPTIGAHAQRPLEQRQHRRSPRAATRRSA